MCVCVCALQVLKETVLMSGFASGNGFVGFASSLFALVHVNFEGRKLGNLDPSGALPGQHSLAVTYAQLGES